MLSATKLNVWRGVVLAALIVLAAVTFLVSSRLAHAARQDQAVRELGVIMERVAQYRAALGGWPRIASPIELMAALRGRIGPDGRLIDHPWFLTGSGLYFENVNTKSVGSAILDPWGRPYQCYYFPAYEGRGELFLLASGGPDGRLSPLLIWSPGTRGSEPEDADNLALWSDSSVVIGAP
jgi:hypothetical protein